MLTHFSLFTGIGGLDLAAEWAGFKTIGQVEKAEYPYQVLCKHWPDVPKWRDIRDVKKINESVTVLSGGFPCQPFSYAGKRKGKDDDRYLWPEMLRLIDELRPTWIVGENVTGIINMALDDVLADLENKDYSTRVFVLPACSVGAPHQRYRVFIVAHFDGNGHDLGTNESIPMEWHEQACSLHWSEPFKTWLEAAAHLCGMDDGVPNRVDRIRALGNAVVPQQAYPIFKAIADIQNSVEAIA